jgi:hypothetical protein
MFYYGQRPELSSREIKKAMNIVNAHGPLAIKKAAGNLGAARGLSPYLGAGQGAGSSRFHHQHHQAVEATL